MKIPGAQHKDNNWNFYIFLLLSISTFYILYHQAFTDVADWSHWSDGYLADKLQEMYNLCSVQSQIT